MVVVTSTASYPLLLQQKPISLKPYSNSSLLYFHHIYKTPTLRNNNNGGILSIKSYMDDSSTFSGIARKIIGSLPVIGLIARIVSDEGGVGGDIIDFAEFRRRVGNKSTVMDSKAFFDFKERRGKGLSIALTTRTRKTEQYISDGDTSYFKRAPVDEWVKALDWGEGDSDLGNAIASNHIHCAKVIYGRCPELLHQQSKKKGYTVLHHAAYREEMPSLLKFVISVADTELHRKTFSEGYLKGMTALCHSIWCKQFVSARLLIKADPDHLTYVDKEGMTPLLHALSYSYGKTDGYGESTYVLLCCWLAAVGAGLLKTEEILEGVARVRISDDLEFEEESFIAMMNEAKERRAKINVETPAIPMEFRVEKALEAIYICCFGKDPIEKEDEELLRVMLKSVFPSVAQVEINRIISEKAKRVAEGSDGNNFPEPKPLSKEAVQLQMKDLQFLRQNSET